MNKESSNPYLGGYSVIYEKLIESLANQRVYLLVVIFLLGNAALGLIIFVGLPMLSLTESDNLGSILLNDFLFLIFEVIAYGVGFGVLMGIATGMRDYSKRTGEFVARIIISTPKPYKDGFGLNSKEINNLAEFAKIEQASSGWKGIFLTTVIWGVILGFFAQMTNQMAIPDIPEFFFLIPEPKNFEMLPIFILWIILVVLGAICSVYLCRFIGNLLGREPANREILIACQEAIALLQDQKLSQKEKLSIKQKKDLAVKLKYVIEDKSTTARRSKNVIPFLDDKGKEFYLVVNTPTQQRTGRESIK